MDRLENVRRFVASQDLVTSWHMVADQSLGLMDVEADDCFEQLASQSRGAAQAISDKRNCLRRCREVGINVAFAERLISLRPSRPPDRIVEAVVRAGSVDQVEALADAHPDWIPDLQRILFAVHLVGALVKELEHTPASHATRRETLARAALSLADPRLDADRYAVLNAELANAVMATTENVEEAHVLYRSAAAVYHQIGEKKREAL